ncbi:MAG: class I SAM-dependent methyltransferase [Candidatus Bathyarchaeota archaeon]|nr:class I SAM-dependent methyltransferase [Candidatus Bathyarchaeota archaeon]
MQLSFTEIFRNSDLLNPVSAKTLFSAGKAAGMAPGISVIDLASGKASPSLRWASTFGVTVEGYERSQVAVDYANARAKLLHLNEQAKYFCQDIADFTPNKKYDVVAALGFDVYIYGGRTQALQKLKSMLKPDGTIILTEPIYTQKPVDPRVLKELGITQEAYLTLDEMQQTFTQNNLKIIYQNTSTKQDWEQYVQPLLTTLPQIIKEKPDLKADAQNMIDHFKAERDNAPQHWSVALWTLKPT